LCLILNRAAQYACTLLGYTLQRGGARPELLSTIKQLEAHMSLTRKCTFEAGVSRMGDEHNWLSFDLWVLMREFELTGCWIGMAGEL